MLSVQPNCRVRDAIALMQKHAYSQMPVVDHGEVLGVFSFRSFAKKAAHSTLDELTKEKSAPGDLSVDEFIEQFEFARVTEEMDHVFDAMDRDNGILVGTPERLIGVLTPIGLPTIPVPGGKSIRSSLRKRVGAAGTDSARVE